MKRLVKILMVLCCVCLLDACQEKQKEGGKPEPIEDYTITPIHGGAVITYTIPSDRDILYVMVEYKRNGEIFTDIASVYDNYLTIEGFNSTDPVDAALYTVNHNKTRSEPKNIVFNPLESPLSLVYKTINVYANFGGITVEWKNMSRIELGVRLMVEEDGEWIEKSMYFSSNLSERHAFRPFDNVETKFALTFEDKWGNVSETVHFVGTPLFEVEIEKPWTDVRAMIPYDNRSDEAPLYQLWDHSTAWDWGQTYYRSNSGSAGSSFTIDIRKVVKLSRVAIWPIALWDQYGWWGVYNFFHVSKFEMWGCKSLDISKLPPANDKYWLHPFSAAQTGQTPPWTGLFADLTPEQIQALPDCFAKDWEYLGFHEVRRLDLEGATPDDIIQAGTIGHHFDIPVESGAVRFIRIFPIEVGNTIPPPNNYWSIAEMSLFGDDTVPQD